MQDVEVDEKWGQEILINDLALYIRQFIKHALEEAIKQELTSFLGYERYQRKNDKRDNSRNGYYERELLTRFGLIEDIQVARDRNGEFESKVLPRYRQREEKIDRQIIDLFISCEGGQMFLACCGTALLLRKSPLKILIVQDYFRLSLRQAEFLLNAADAGGDWCCPPGAFWYRDGRFNLFKYQGGVSWVS